MPDILHRITIDAPAAHVHRLLATADGVGQWWNGRPLDGDTTPGSTFGIRFGSADRPAAVMEVLADSPEQVTWRVIGGPADWLETQVTFRLRAEGAGVTTLLFTHSGWREANEFMSGCSTNWGSYLTSLKFGAEGGAFAPYPAGEISRWS